MRETAETANQQGEANGNPNSGFPFGGADWRAFVDLSLDAIAAAINVYPAMLALLSGKAAGFYQAKNRNKRN